MQRSASVLAILLAAFAVPAPVHGATDGSTGGATNSATDARQEWQVRRAEFSDAVAAAKSAGADSPAQKTVERIATEFRRHPNRRTPLEAMDILGLYVVSKEGVRATMPAIVREAVLGWYDLCQWASESGKAEIINQERFLARALYLAGGKSVGDEWAAYIRSDPPGAEKLIEDGIRDAAQPGMTDEGYDHHWPSAYGSGPPAAPRMNHDDALAAAIHRIRAYYLPGSM